MTSIERRQQREERDANVCAYYVDGHTQGECAAKFGVSRQRVNQIVRAAGIARQVPKGARTQFLGVNVSSETKTKLKAQANAKGTSVSKFASDALDELTKDGE